MGTADEFIRRFLFHVLPKRFVRIRHYGLLAGRNVSIKLARCRQLLGVPDVEQPVERTWLNLDCHKPYSLVAITRFSFRKSLATLTRREIGKRIATGLPASLRRVRAIAFP
jgi:hypothetical protein